MTVLSFATSIAAYEAALAARFGASIRRADLTVKHEKMAKDAFQFLRGTCWRWAEAAATLCPELCNAPEAGSVGDAHAGNFGLWRDAQFRLVWGVDDYDEAARLPYPLDLVRLGASLILVGAGAEPYEVADWIQAGYGDGLAAPEPFVLESRHLWLRDLFEAGPEKRERFWNELDALHEAPVEPEAFDARLRAALPTGTSAVRIMPRQAGVGSLGRPRFVALGQYRGGPIAAEIKGGMPSCWTLGREAGLAESLAGGPHRSPDPTLVYDADAVLRRLAPNSGKLKFAEVKPKLQGQLIAAIAGDLAAIHAGAGDSGEIRHDLERRPAGWLTAAIRRVAQWTEGEWNVFKRQN
ncbi:hypothetical protein BJF93_14310 [Xaviernesmea oryzae]|uniref:DUF2252 domain-containing protein n=1 Tax=Xaviernesmea oryzae TaxID=464029 RepID=A0A1Q9AXI1_9HYPH|nr:DUF2252 family protein [Xaviernesmea oryzae]OLP60154.1 hypothetical protein BJF93_14310 [Xaviernesmea oryzae]SEM37542.1 hypothetical protein SAMN04487976_1353 [Xaviernesmea oryzae]